jgi:hypothetical protein
MVDSGKADPTETFGKKSEETSTKINSAAKIGRRDMTHLHCGLIGGTELAFVSAMLLVEHISHNHNIQG